jgi:hypothetical protein
MTEAPPWAQSLTEDERARLVTALNKRCAWQWPVLGKPEYRDDFMGQPDHTADRAELLQQLRAGRKEYRRLAKECAARSASTPHELRKLPSPPASLSWANKGAEPPRFRLLTEDERRRLSSQAGAS